MSDESGGRVPATVELSEQDVQSRLAATMVGVWVTMIVSLGCEVYALATWDQPHRLALVLVGVVGLLSGPVVAALPLKRIIRSHRRELFFVAWTTTDVIFISLCAALDGGTQSPYALLFVLPFLFGALSYPLWVTTLIGGIATTAYLLVAVLFGGGALHSGFGAFTLVCVGLLASWEARNQGRRRNQLTESADALRDSEETSRLRAEQQREVARFGQLALEGADIPELTGEASKLMTKVLELDLAGVMRLLPGGEELLLVAAIGVPKQAIGEARVPTGLHSQSGYALTQDDPVVVADWKTETRFEQSELQSSTGMRSAAIVVIRAKGEPYGVLGAGSRKVGWFSQEDVSFLQAIAHVLANAIARRRSEDRTRHDALHDPLTGLPNRSLFLDRLALSLAHSRRNGSSVGVLFLDLDQFKLVNDSLGHAAGDELLAAVAPRLQEALRPDDTVARFGGDEFAVLAPDIASERDAIRVAERIAEAMTRPFVVRRTEHFASTSVGISIGSGDEEPEALIRDADAALYRAKDKGRGGYELFDEVMRSRVIDHIETENDLRRALQRREFELYFQPVVSLRDHSTSTYEALLRWRHPERGMLPPAAFIPVAEESRLIVPIGRWVIEEACRRAAAWQQLSPDAAPIGIAINLSACQLADPDLVRCVAGAVERAGIDPPTVQLELTESTLLEEVDDPERVLAALKDLGVGLVLDDFGTGFSSLGYLKRLPLSGIKLDRSFVEDLTEGGGDAAIVRAVTDMASALGLSVCAEGIETEEQLEAVRELQCSHAQGFYFARPEPVDDLMERLRARVKAV